MISSVYSPQTFEYLHHLPFWTIPIIAVTVFWVLIASFGATVDAWGDDRTKQNANVMI